MFIPWWAWAAVAAAMSLLEFHLPGTYFIWVGLGAAITALADAVFGGLALETQILVFAGGAAASCGVGFFVYRAVGRFPAEESRLNRRDQRMLGEHGIVAEGFVGGRGKVRFGDTVWLAEGPDLPRDAQVVVTAVRGARVIVKGVERA